MTAIRAGRGRPARRPGGRIAAAALLAVALLAAAGRAGAALPAVAAEPRAAAETCLAQAVSYEAGAEPEAGREAVAQVVLNRLRDPAFPKTVCGVVFQGAERRTGCQFTFACDGSLARRRPVNWPDAVRIARDALDGTLASAIGGATHYHADYVRPGWATRLTRVARIGAHIFYVAVPGAPAPPDASAAAGAAPRAAAFSAWGLALAVLRPGRDGVRVERAVSPPPAPGTADRAFP